MDVPPLWLIILAISVGCADLDTHPTLIVSTVLINVNATVHRYSNITGWTMDPKPLSFCDKKGVREIRVVGNRLQK